MNIRILTTRARPKKKQLPNVARLIPGIEKPMRLWWWSINHSPESDTRCDGEFFARCGYSRIYVMGTCKMDAASRLCDLHKSYTESRIVLAMIRRMRAFRNGWGDQEAEILASVTPGPEHRAWGRVLGKWNVLEPLHCDAKEVESTDPLYDADRYDDEPKINGRRKFTIKALTAGGEMARKRRSCRRIQEDRETKLSIWKRWGGQGLIESLCRPVVVLRASRRGIRVFRTIKPQLTK